MGEQAGAPRSEMGGEARGELLDRVPVGAVREELGDALDSAREAVADVVESELRDLRKAIRRQRKRLGI